MTTLSSQDLNVWWLLWFVPSILWRDLGYHQEQEAEVEIYLCIVMYDRGRRFCQQYEGYELDLSLSSAAEVVKTAVISSGKQMQRALQNINECGDE